MFWAIEIRIVTSWQDEVQERNDEKDLHHKKNPTRTMPLSKPVHRLVSSNSGV